MDTSYLSQAWQNVKADILNFAKFTSQQAYMISYVGPFWCSIVCSNLDIVFKLYIQPKAKALNIIKLHYWTISINVSNFMATPKKYYNHKIV